MKIPYGHQSLSETDYESVLDVLKSDFLTQGDTVPKFEASIAEYVSSKYGVATNSGTTALHIACKALGLEENDWLWTSPNSFVASSNAALYCGAKIDFIDIDSNTYNLDINVLKTKLEEAETKNQLPKIIMPVHFAGQSCEMKQIKDLSEKYGFYIIEDAAHALGGQYLGKNIGDCSYSDVCVFSFHPVKSITTAEGGMAVTNNQELFESMQSLRTHGMKRRNLSKNNDLHGPWISEMTQLGFNYRMNDIQAALGISQLNRLDQFISKRNEIANYYTSELSHLPLSIQEIQRDCYSAFHLYVVRLQLEKTNKTRDQFMEKLLDFGIGASIHYQPIHLHPFYEQMGFKKGDFPMAEEYYKRAISIPMFPDLKKSELKYIVECISEALN